VVNAQLDPVGTPTPAGDRGRIQLEVGSLKAGDAAVLLNGKTPQYFVGHIDEFNNNIWWEQELIVPPGTHEVTVTRHNNVIWSGPVTVASNQRVIVDISDGKVKDKDWVDRGTRASREMKRFRAGTASATIVVAPVSGNIAVSPSQIDCSQPAQVKWASAETIDAEISGMSPVPTSGEKTVSPKQTTTYEFTATGPGGVTKSNTTLNVNPVVVANVEASPAEVRYRRIGDKVIHQDSATVNWSTSNAETVAVDPFGTVQPSGSQTQAITPTQTNDGPVDETVTYTLKASNTCGGAETKTASVHVVGSIEPIPVVPLHSVFYPTAYPMKAYPLLGLVNSQREILANLAAGFIKYLEYDPEAKLKVVAYTDPRGANKYNDLLANRRVELVKQVLMSNGIAEARIETEAAGEHPNLEPNTIAELEAQNPNPMPEQWAKQKRVNELAYQRRVDIVLLPTNKESLRFYPNTAPEAKILRQATPPSRRVVMENQPAEQPTQPQEQQQPDQQPGPQQNQ
jgi:OmpA family